MTDEMTTVTEILPFTGETREREISKKELEALFDGAEVNTVGPSEHGGLFTHTIEFPEATEEEKEASRIRAMELEREVHRQIAEIQQFYHDQIARAALIYGVPPGAFETHVEITPDPKPNVWQRLKEWIVRPEPEPEPEPRTMYDPTMLQAYCTPFDRRAALSGRRHAPQRGGQIGGAHATMTFVNEGMYAAITRAGVPQPGGMPPNPSGQSRLDEAEARWEKHVGIGVANG